MKRWRDGMKTWSGRALVQLLDMELEETEDTTGPHLLSTALLQTVQHLLKLVEADLHLLLQLDHEGLVVRVQVVVRLLCVQAES